MKAVVFKATRTVAVEEVPDARVERDDDVVVRVTSSALCGTDLHMYDGRTGATAGMVLGHEGLGIVEAVGPAVHRVKRGDRVVLPAHIFCGVCFNCARGDSAACLRIHPGQARRVRADPRPPVHHAPARPDHQRPRPPRPGGHPPRAAPERP